ncbi:hypothetical protein WJX81_005381 [Elliptochloris bilobata]|uniref:Tyrosine specific protein phosphatases domain-containing protein n=1 Tax=Elliptochloris bilobata TaxID=381761 RepID=A0AAW1QNL8_9CHLO
MGIHLSGLVGGIATLPAVLAVLLRRHAPLPVTLVLCHIALTGFAVSIAASDAMAADSTGLLGKDRDGVIGWWAWPLFWPYHLALRVKLHYQRWVSTEPLYSRIADGWYLGGWPAHGDLVPPGGPAVVDVTCELPRRHSQPYSNVPVWDTHAPTPAQIEAGVRWALRQREAGRPVYVHCAHGHGRSTVVLCAALIRTGLAADPKAALALARAGRPRARFNYRQQDALEAWFRGQGARDRER